MAIGSTSGAMSAGRPARHVRTLEGAIAGALKRSQSRSVGAGNRRRSCNIMLLNVLRAGSRIHEAADTPKRTPDERRSHCSILGPRDILKGTRK